MSVFNYASSCEESLKEGYGEWQGYKNCNYCGSMCPEELTELIQAGKAIMGGSDWKYGYPHKFYVRIKEDDGNIKNSKFYTRHLQFIDDDIFRKIIPFINQACGITFDKDEKGLKYSAPYHGFQKSMLG